MSEQRQPILVATCGNRFAGDDAFGPLLAELLLRDGIPGVEVVDLAMQPTDLVDVLENREALVIADAAVCPQMPVGTLLECDWDSAARPPLLHDEVMSTHGLSVGGQVELARALGMLPPVIRLLAVNLGQTSAGAHASDDVTKQLEPARRRIVALAQEINLSFTEMWYGTAQDNHDRTCHSH